MPDYRIEADSLGQIRVPVSAYYGAHTQRALENFPISGRCMPGEFIHAIGIIKWAAAETNMALGLLDKGIGNAVVQAPREVTGGAFLREFVMNVPNHPCDT